MQTWWIRSSLTSCQDEVVVTLPNGGAFQAAQHLKWVDIAFIELPCLLRHQGDQRFSFPGLGLQVGRSTPYRPTILECSVLSCCEMKLPKDRFSELTVLLLPLHFLMVCRASGTRGRTSNVRFSTYTGSESTKSPYALRIGFFTERSNLPDALEFNQVVIFVKSVQRASFLEKLLVEGSFPFISICSGLNLEDCIGRCKALQGFREMHHCFQRPLPQGIDIERVNAFINYDMPGDSDSHLQRVGRTGRF